MQRRRRAEGDVHLPVCCLTLSRNVVWLCSYAAAAAAAAANTAAAVAAVAASDAATATTTAAAASLKIVF